MYGIVLAGGESKRIGSPKALLKINSETFVERIAHILWGSGIQNIVVVGGTHYKEISRGLNNVKVIFNARHEFGQFSSLQAALHEIPKRVDFVIVWPVDLPLVRKETIKKLISAAQNPITVPVYQGRKGHPVIYSAETITKILSMEPTQTGKDLFDYFKDRITFTDVEDAAVLIDIDTPEDYEKHIKRGGLSLPT